MLCNTYRKCPTGCWFRSVHFWSWLYQGSAVGVLPRMSLCYLNTMLLCFSEEESEPNKFWGRRLFRDTHTVPSADGMLCFMSWKSVEKSTREGKHGMSLSYLKKHFNTSNCKERGRKRGETEERGRNKREWEKKKRLKLDYHRVQLQNNDFPRHFTGECVRQNKRDFEKVQERISFHKQACCAFVFLSLRPYNIYTIQTLYHTLLHRLRFVQNISPDILLQLHFPKYISLEIYFRKSSLNHNPSLI